MEQIRKLSPSNWLILLMLGLFSFALFLGFIRWAYDDPFISYRYANNLAHGIGFVYNAGEQILSTTTPLFTVLLALAGLFTSEFHVVAIAIGVISIGLGGFLIYDLARTLNSPIVGWTGLLLYPTSPLVVSTLGSETPIYLTFCLAAFAFYARKNILATGIFAALATLTRPDGVLIIAILGLDYIVRSHKSIQWKPVLISGAILFSWIGFAWLYFGSPLPATLAVKQQQGTMEISELFAQGLTTIITNFSSRLFFVEIILGSFGVIFALWKKRYWLIFLVWPILYFIAYSMLGVTRYFWYYAPLIPGFIVAIGLGLSVIPELVKKYSPNKQFLAYLSLFIPGILLVLLFATNGRSLWHLRIKDDPRYGIYKAAGEWLRDNTLPDEQVGILEVGIVGYYAQRPMVDFAGLVQPNIAEQFNIDTNYQDAAFWTVEQYKLDYLVLQDGMFGRFEKEYVKPYCEKVKRFKGKQYSYDYNLTIYDCR